MHECFEGPLMFKRLWIWGNMNPSFFKFPPPPPLPFIMYQNIPLLKCHMLEYSNAFSFLAPSECNQYKILNDSDRRSDVGRGDRKCDRNLTEDWYRFSAGAGTSIPTHCSPKLRCGKDLPGWMDGAYPTVDGGVASRKVCFHGYGKCCYLNIMINVRNCSSFFVYRLKPVQYCNSWYCGKS